MLEAVSFRNWSQLFPLTHSLSHPLSFLRTPQPLYSCLLFGWVKEEHLCKIHVMETLDQSLDATDEELLPRCSRLWNFRSLLNHLTSWDSNRRWYKGRSGCLISIHKTPKQTAVCSVFENLVFTHTLEMVPMCRTTQNERKSQVDDVSQSVLEIG